MAIVAVVTPCFNNEGYLASCVESIQRQTLTDWSMTIVDDASTDGSAAVAASFAEHDPRVHLVRQPANRGVAAARNRGAVAAADAPYLFFLDADDVVEPEMLAATVAHLNANPDVAMVYTGHSYIGPDDEFLGEEPGEWPWVRYCATRFGVRRIPPTTPATPFASIYLVAAILPSLAVIRRSAYDATNGWDESFGHLCEDTDMFLQLALLGPVHHLPTSLVRYRRHPAQVTAGGTFQAQFDKLQRKWRDMPELSAAQRETVEAARWFRERRFVAFRHLVDARQSLGERRPLHALRATAAAARTYSPRRPPGSTLG